MTAVNVSNKYQDIIRFCFWDCKLTLQGLDEWIKSDDIEEKRPLFDKLLREYPDWTIIFDLFSRETLVHFVSRLKPAMGFHTHQQNRIMLLRNILLGEHNVPKLLEWTE
jgi:hypothetical protein